MIAPPFDVMTTGRMAILQDPQGAGLALWEARDHPGARLVNEPGALVLNQLDTSDPEEAARFYSGLFGWALLPVASDPQPYWGIQNRGAPERRDDGPAARRPEPARTGWSTSPPGTSTPPSRGSGSSAARCVVPPMPIPAGRIAVARDPQGAVFALFEGPVDP